MTFYFLLDGKEVGFSCTLWHSSGHFIPLYVQPFSLDNLTENVCSLTN